MDRVTVVFTKSNFSFISWLIRWALPRSRFALALSSHCLVKLGNEVDGYRTFDMGFGMELKEVDWQDAMKDRVAVATRIYLVPDLAAGIAFAKMQLGKKYDTKGAFGLAIAPSRDWSNEEDWFCYEFAAAFLKASGLDIFHSLAHITETALLSLRSH